MNLPDVRLYSYTSLLDQMKFWFIPDNDKLWLNIEREVSKGNDLFSLSNAYYLLPKVTIPTFLMIKSTLAAWKYALFKLQPMEDSGHIPIPLRFIDYCKAHLLGSCWITQRFNYYYRLLDNYKKLITNKLKMIVSLLIWEYFISNKAQRIRGISFFYKLLSSFPNNMKSLNMIKWGKDLSQTLSWDS